ncbi:RNA polymerase I-specific transcription initiation factor RRN3 [Meira miltonrushii]|uniref:RNA polymerase I-specific transcription initiation factor RRN3 n=1 Tax=Meira miltonrushii TaxID=1280837 RepID=A0A316VLI5_9BASI|nr:RNA polymerase I-specific transcription initiation factor RRN3 [Meira miltonrushii]PWN38377.1 RNA polymerase I-specific transcription initiation factor RRN3 [Meira miltonrushii]
MGSDSPSESDKRGFYFDYVKKALADKMRGQDKEYLELVAQFNLPSQTSTTSAPPPIGLLQMLLHALTGVASKLDRRNHHALVNAILTLPWATMGGDIFARTWIRFVCTLCSGRSEWVSEVLARAIKGFSYRSDWRSMSYAPAASSSSSKPTRRLIYGRIHTLLRSLLSLIPTLPSQLAPLIQRHFPHKADGIREHVVFVQNMFEICEYADDLRPNILELVIGRSVEIDVEIQIELDELEEAEADLEDADLDGIQESNLISDGDLLDKPLDADSDSDDEGDDSEDDAAGLDDLDSDGDDDLDELRNGKVLPERERIKQVRSLAEKLDAMMSTLFRNMETMDRRYSNASKGIGGTYDLSPARAIALRNEQFGNLLRIFERTLLPTFKSRHVQFLLFWCASLERSYSETFIGMLLNKAIYTNSGDEFDSQTGWRIKEGSPVVMRIAAASYVASLVARAKFVDAEDARIIMLNLCAFLDAHMDAYSQGLLASQSPIGLELEALNGPHAMFYAVAQACFYIFCFRWRDLHSTDDAAEQDEDASEDDDEANEYGNKEDVDGSGRVRWCNGIDSIKRAILSQFNPLAHCSATVVKQFASVAQLTGFMYCWNIIERNSRSSSKKHDGGSTPTLSRTNSMTSLHSPAPARSNSTSTVTTTMISAPGAQDQSTAQSTFTPPTSTNNDIDSFFPFDPYRLRSSTKWVEPLYREWADVAPEGMIDESETEDDEEDDDDEKLNDDADSASSGQSYGASVSTDDSSSVARSLEAMSISPRFV